MWNCKTADSRSTIILFPQNNDEVARKERRSAAPLLFSGDVQMRESDSITEIKGVGPKTAQLFESHGVTTVRDLLTYYPRDYDEYGEICRLSDAVPGRIQAYLLVIVGSGTVIHNGKRTIVQFKAADATGEVRLTFFNMPYIIRTLRPGTRRVFRGALRVTAGGRLFLQQPRTFTQEEYGKLAGSLQPVYPLFQGIKNSQIMRMEKYVLDHVDLPEDYLSNKERESMNLADENSALVHIHFPGSREELHSAHRRLVFDEFFAFIFAVRSERTKTQALRNERPLARTKETERLIGALPYRLTGAQLRAWREIEADLSRPFVMNRLLQGDVGSGKTIVAFLALLMCAENGRQGILMAPTEVLARQHMKDLTQMTKDYGLHIHPVYLTGSVTGRARRNVLEEIETGAADVIIGTHALIQDAVNYRDVGLVITDEQHRFGVRQRESLAGKGESVPVLVMSATPIPRTLAIILYGDLSVSVLDEMPQDRLRTKNLAISVEGRGKVYRFMYSQIRQGRQCYVICPEVEEGELSGLENVTDYTEKLRKIFPPQVRIDSLNGRMKPAEKDAVMQKFEQHGTDILVSTTVIEVGINVPNATVMVIENAERFGLSQLHQLRGRVGRGKFQSYCVFLYSGGADKPKRLEILEHTNDGFKIAEEDLKMRGPGDVFGTRQSGDLGFVLADIYDDSDVMKTAAHFVSEKLRDDPGYTNDRVKPVDFRSI